MSQYGDDRARRADRRSVTAGCLAATLLIGACSTMTDLEPLRAERTIVPSGEVMVAAVKESRRIYEERQRAGVRDTINVAKCLMGRLQPDGTYRRWPIVLPLPDDPDTDDRRKRDFIYRGTPPGETVPTHIADCTVPNSPAAVDHAFRAIAGMVVPRMPLSK